jgi:hypothetical protein
VSATDSVDRKGWGLLPPKEVREQKQREWAAGIEKAGQGGWTSCEVEDHIEEVRTRNDELAQMLAERPFDGFVLETVFLHVGAVGELLEHCEGLHAPDVLVRAIEA